ncbi:hypothetical protein IBTHAUMO2_510008 [Nitrosopumilaceae archaeon]|nr:hypothetical protein [Nitrosopumilus sp.]CAI9831958.1 hypothetical protein IBTHAUMO2_510008 [Nitrosopumilaceae archaeon]
MGAERDINEGVREVLGIVVKKDLEQPVGHSDRRTGENVSYVNVKMVSEEPSRHLLPRTLREALVTFIGVIASGGTLILINKAVDLIWPS